MRRRLRRRFRLTLREISVGVETNDIQNRGLRLEEIRPLSFFQ
jgi:D-alanine-D-alanine ligase-like ATP-grasp enzyme